MIFPIYFLYLSFLSGNKFIDKDAEIFADALEVSTRIIVLFYIVICVHN